MANSLTLTIGGDSSKLRADLALAQADLRALTRELNATANAARRTGADLDFARLGQAAGQFDSAAASVARLKSELAATRGPAESLTQELDHGFGRLGSVIREPLDALAMFKSSLRQTAEIAGVTFAVDEVKKFVTESAELGETTLNNGSALGMSVQAYAQFAGALRLAGADAQTAQRTIEHLAQSVQQALSEPLAKTGATLGFRQLGVSIDELKAKGNDLPKLFELILNRADAMAPGLQRTAALHTVLGRGMDSLAGALREGAAGFRENMQAASDNAAEMAKQGPVLDKDATALHQLGLEWDTFKLKMAPVVDFFVHKLTDMGTAMGQFVAVETSGWNSIVASMKGFVAMTDAAAQAAARLAGLHVGGAPNTGFAALKGMDLLRASRHGMAGLEHPNSPQEGRPFGAMPAAPAAVPFTVATTPAKPRASRVRGGGGGGRDEAFALAEEGAGAIRSADADILRGFAAQMQALVALKKITAQQASGFDLEKSGQLAGQQGQALDKLMAMADATDNLAEKTRVYWQQWRLGVGLQEKALDFTKQIAEATKKAADEAARAAEKAAKAIAAPFTRAFDAIGQDLETSFNKLAFDALVGAKSAQKTYYTSFRTPQGQYLMQPHQESPLAAAGLQLGQKIATQLGDAIETSLSKSLATSLFGAGTASFGAGLTKMLGIGQPGGLFGSGLLGGAGTAAQAASTTANTTALASLTLAVGANTAALTTGGAASVAGGGLGAASAAGSAGGLFSGIGSLVHLLFARGGIVPAAAGGWALPSSFGSDRVMAALTPGEMVLPRHLSDGFQRMLGGGGAPGGAEGGGDAHLHIHGNIVDAPGVERFFKDNKRHIAAVVQGALRSGAINPLA